MAKAAPKKKTTATKAPKKNTGRPVRAAVQAARAEALRKLEEAEQNQQTEKEVVIETKQDAPMSSAPQHVVVDAGESGDVSVEITTNEVTDEAKTPEKQPEMTTEQVDDADSAAEAIAAQNVGEAIASENSTEYASVRKNVSSSRLFFAALGTGILLGVIIFGGWLLYDAYGGDIKIPSSVMKPTVTPSKEPSPSPTTVSINPGDYKVDVLNGTGVSGAAGDVESSLNTAGFTNTTTGNASEYGFTDTEVAMKSDVPSAVFDAIKKSLPDYSVVEVTSLPTDGNYDVVVTVGTTK
jgi:hypothetical protein